MSQGSEFLNNIKAIVEANGWEKDLVVEEMDPPGPPGWTPGEAIVRIRAAGSSDHPDPAETVGVYLESQTFPEQIQDECLRFQRARNIRQDLSDAAGSDPQ